MATRIGVLQRRFQKRHHDLRCREDKSQGERPTPVAKSPLGSRILRPNAEPSRRLDCGPVSRIGNRRHGGYKNWTGTPIRGLRCEPGLRADRHQTSGGECAGQGSSSALNTLTIVGIRNEQFTGILANNIVHPTFVSVQHLPNNRLVVIPPSSSANNCHFVAINHDRWNLVDLDHHDAEGGHLEIVMNRPCLLVGRGAL